MLPPQSPANFANPAATLDSLQNGRSVGALSTSQLLPQPLELLQTSQFPLKISWLLPQPKEEMGHPHIISGRGRFYIQFFPQATPRVSSPLGLHIPTFIYLEEGSEYP